MKYDVFKYRCKIVFTEKMTQYTYILKSLNKRTYNFRITF